MSRRPHIVVTEPLSADAVARLRAAGDVTVLADCSAATVLGAIGDCQALVVRTYTQVTGEVIEAAPRLRVIGRAGVGLDNIDTAVAARRDVTVVYRPAAATQAVAEWVIAATTVLARGMLRARDAMLAGHFFDGRRAAGGRQLDELTFGIVGCGRIGRRVAAIAHHGYGCPILYNDILETARPDCPARSVSKDALFAAADVVTLHVPLTPQTRGLIGAPELARMRPATLLINSARGAVVDGVAVAAALQEGTLGGCALDVFDPEPLPSDHPLLTAPNCLLTPHIGARTATAQAGMNDVVDDVVRVLDGQAPVFCWAPAGDVDSPRRGA